MSYIGRGLDKISNIEKLDTITFDGSSSYTLQKNSVNFTPSSANNLQVSIDGVVQAGNFTVSGSTIDFGTAVPGTSTNDFIFHYGTGLITTPADGTVSLAKLSATGTKDATTFLRGDNTFGVPPLGGITVADQWRLTADFGGNATPIASNLEQVDTAGQGTLGSAMTQSSGIFTFPSTGIYFVNFVCTHYPNVVNDDEITIEIHVTINNSTYTPVSVSYASQRENERTTTIATSLIDVTDTSNVKVRFDVNGQDAANQVLGNTAQNETHFTFIRLGDT